MNTAVTYASGAEAQISCAAQIEGEGVREEHTATEEEPIRTLAEMRFWTA